MPVIALLHGSPSRSSRPVRGGCFIADEHRAERRVDVVVRPADLLLLQKAGGSERLEILARSQTRDAEVPLNELDLRVGLREEVVDQILAVEPEPLAYPVFRGQQRLTDSNDRPDRVPRRVLDRLEHVEHPLLPSVPLAHGLQEPVIVALSTNNVPAEVKDRNVEEPFLDQIKDVDDSPGAAVAVVERVKLSNW